jgi:hypothetical protein
MSYKKEIEEKGLYDFICNNHWNISKDGIVNLLKEFNFAVHSLDKNLCKQAEIDMLDELEIDDDLDPELY